MSVYGTEVPREGSVVGVIGEVARSQSGNVILRVGRRNGEGWQQTEHVVLTDAEAEELIAEIRRTQS